MLRGRAKPSRLCQRTRRFYSSHNVFPPVQTSTGPLSLVSIEEFRAKAFIAEKPLLIRAGSQDGNTPAAVKRSPHSIPAAEKWFIHRESGTGPGDSTSHTQSTESVVIPSQEYLLPHASTILPYELLTPSAPDLGIAEESEIYPLLKNHLQYSDLNGTFHRFSAPLSLFLLASRTPSPPALYIAQAQIIDLPPTLQADLPAPHLVLQAGRGDIYDANVWMGIPPTYTPLHKDPNPNLFVQLAGRKRVRFFEPREGMGIFRHVRERIGEAGHGGAIRGSEMMEGPERAGLWDAVWGRGSERREGNCLEAVVGPGDALFIPKGWWHSFMSVGDGVTGSVNWWFR